MFNSIKRLIQELRIWMDFPKYETLRLKAHIAEASLRFNTAQLEREIAAIKRSAGDVASEKFDQKIDAVAYEIASLDRNIDETQCCLALFERDYRGELNDLHAQKEALFQEKNSLHAEMEELKHERSEAHMSLQNAYDDLQTAKDSVDSWYSKSERTPVFFGNAGRKLPKHSIFGQSFGDLDEYKRDRGAAVSEIGGCKENLSEIRARQRDNKDHRNQIRAQLSAVFEQINAVKNDRQRMYELKQKGMRQSSLERKLSDYLSRRVELTNLRRAMEAERRAHVEQSEFQMGIKEREAALEQRNVGKTRFLEEFHLPGQLEIRRADHRKRWMSEHGITAKR